MRVMGHIKRFTRRLPYLYGAARKKIHKISDLRQDEICALQADLLDAHLTFASRLPPYQNFRGLDLLDWPLLEKKDLLGREELFRSGLRLTSIGQSGGTTGTPVAVQRSLSSVVYEQATIDRAAERVGVDLSSARVAVLRGTSFKDPNDNRAPFWRRLSINEAELSSQHLNRANIKHFISFLEDFQPDVLFAYPSALDNLISLIRDSRPQFALKLVMTSSEVCRPGLRGDVFDVFGCRHLDYYGQAERVAFAWSIEDNRYFFSPDYSQVEFLSGGDGLHEIVGTNFNNRAQPLIRYRTGDLANLVGCDVPAVLAGLAPFPSIQGRTAEFVELADGSRIIGLNHLHHGLKEVLFLQLVQEDFDLLKIVIVKSGAGDDESLKAAITERIRVKIPNSVRLKWDFRGEPVKSPAGKVPLLIRTMK